MNTLTYIFLSLRKTDFYMYKALELRWSKAIYKMNDLASRMPTLMPLG